MFHRKETLLGHMNEPTQITDTRKRYAAGVLKYAQMGYWDGDYQPKETDVLALFRADGFDEAAVIGEMVDGESCVDVI